MATKYTTRTATMRQSQVVDQRKIAVGKKVEIGGKYGTVVSDEKVETKEVETKKIETKDVYTDRLFIDYEGKSTNILELIGGGTPTPPPTPSAGTINIVDGNTGMTYSDISKIKFQGSGIRITQDSDGSIIITVTGEAPAPIPSVTNMVMDIDTSKKRIYSWTSYYPDKYALPSGKTSGAEYDLCHDITTPVTLTFKGNGDTFGFNNLTTKIRVKLTKKVKTGDNTIITIDSPNLDGSASTDTKWTFVNNKVVDGLPTYEKIELNVLLDSLEDFGIGGAWSLNAFVLSSDGTESEIKTNTTDEHFSYTKNPSQPSRVDGSEITVEAHTKSPMSSDVYVSGIPQKVLPKIVYAIDVTSAEFTNTVYMVSEANRGVITIVDKNGTDMGSATIDGANNDDPTSKVSTTMYVDLEETEYTAPFTITQTMEGLTKPITKEYTPEQGEGKVLKYDTYNTAYFEREDTETEDDIYGRVLGTLNCDDVWTPILTLSENAFDSMNQLVNNTTDDLYNHQAVVKQGTLVHPKASGYEPYENDTDTGNKYYIRKFMINPDSDEAALNIQIKLSGFDKCDNESKEAWLIVYNRADDYCQGGRIDKVVSDDDVGLASSSTIINNIFTIDTSASILPLIMKNQEFYIVVILKDESASITGQIEVAEKF